MEKGQQVFPHKYTRRELHDGKWVYFYGSANQSVGDALKKNKSYRVVIANGAPTQISVDEDGDVAFGPPNAVGKKLFLNTNPAKSYFAIARDVRDPDSLPVYMYTESYLKKAASKKAAKFLKASRALQLLDKDAEVLMRSTDPEKQEYGLAIWLNNNTQMRIGAHDSAASVDPKERAAILRAAHQENWSDELKNKALQSARHPTYGLLSLQHGHLDIDATGRFVTFRFIGKGGKENIYTIQPPELVMAHLMRKKFGGGNVPDRKLFERVNYKKVWRMYRQYGTNPHVSRGAFAEHLVNQLMKDFNVYDSESGKHAVSRFNSLLQKRVSERLNHTRSMTERSYLTDTTRKMLQEFRSAILERQERGSMQESASDHITNALAEGVLWLELGAGNTVI